MNPRHAAALALVGWYLMMPTPKDLGAPLGEWGNFGSYDTAKECEAAKQQAIHISERHGFALLGYDSKDVRRSYMLASCIVSDDPRLKEK